MQAVTTLQNGLITLSLLMVLPVSAMISRHNTSSSACVVGIPAALKIFKKSIKSSQ
jgi:hypothetical protein